MCAWLPSVFKAAKRACSAESPASRCSSASRSRCVCNSRSRSSFISHLDGHAHDPGDRLGDAVPVGFFGGELLPAGGRQPVVLALALSLSEHFPFRRDPALALEAMERRIQRPMFQAEDVVGRALDVLGDLMPVRRAK